MSEVESRPNFVNIPVLECEERVIMKIRIRRDKGREKYGCTMERSDLGLIDWMKHAQEEAIDFAIYLEKLIEETLKAKAFNQDQIHRLMSDKPRIEPLPGNTFLPKKDPSEPHKYMHTP